MIIQIMEQVETYNSLESQQRVIVTKIKNLEKRIGYNPKQRLALEKQIKNLWDEWHKLNRKKSEIEIKDSKPTVYEPVLLPPQPEHIHVHEYVRDPLAIAQKKIEVEDQMNHLLATTKELQEILLELPEGTTPYNRITKMIRQNQTEYERLRRALQGV